MKTRFLLAALVFPALAFCASAPSFQGELMDGTKVSLKEELAKKKPLLLSFWATWCGPCLEELDHVQANLQKDRNLNLNWLTVNTDTPDTSVQVKPTVRLHKFKFPVVKDESHSILNKYHMDGSLPYSVLIGTDGKIVRPFSGYSEEMFAAVRNYVEKSDTGKSVEKKTNN